MGGSGAMGQAIARLAFRHGAQVTIAGRDKKRLAVAAEAIGPGVAQVEVDVASEAGLLSLAAREGGPYDHVVVATSANARASSIPATTLPDVQRAFGRYWTTYLVLHYAKRLLTQSGSVTVLSGSSGRRPVAGYGVWSALHGGIEALAKAAALELAPIRVNVLSPGGIGIQPDRNLVHHAGQAEDMASAAVMLMGNPAMTAAVIDVDGGERLGTWSGDSA
ncbi:MAG: SDR family oxidoreductase [Chitinophagaceae bacterium]|nr:SDR family oxidoreductase [Rubrivivax sp.]